MQTRVYFPTPLNLRRLAAALRRGELVALPTETVYGLAAHALDARACRRIFSAKRRPADDPLIVHVLGLRAAEALAEFNAAARVLARRFWPGPLTLVLPRHAIVPDIVTSGQDTVALRAPAHPLARRLLRLAGIPLAAPSANPFGYVSPTTAGHVLDGLRGRIPHVLDGGPCPVGVESTIVDLSDPRHPCVLRPGAISAQELENALQAAGHKVRIAVQQRPDRDILAPGLQAQHYSPHTPLQVCRRIGSIAGVVPPDATTARIYWQRPVRGAGPNVFWLTEQGRTGEAAQNLYAVLRRADAGGFKRLLVELAPRRADALAVALTDRLARAAGRRAR
ncbi:MAG: L-threonylcarbamoyladenylate synthase [Opitutales bacterium]